MATGVVTSSKRVVHEAEFAQNSALRANFDNQTVIAHLEGVNPTALDTGIPGEDVLPFYQTTPGPFSISLRTDKVTNAALLSAQDQVLQRLVTGDQTVQLSAGHFKLRLSNSTTDDALLAVAPLSTPSQVSAQTLSSSKPGVYIDDLANVPLIQGASTSIAAFVGYNAKGPSELQTVSSYRQFVSLFGNDTTPTSLALYQYFLNGGQIAIVVPTAGTTAADISAALPSLHNQPFSQLILTDATSMPSTEADSALSSALAYCSQENALLLFDFPSSVAKPQQAIDWLHARPQLRSKYAACYWPQLNILLPDQTLQAVSPLGTMAGIYALNDSQTGVFNAPAGVDLPLMNVQSPTYVLNDEESSLINPQDINGIRSFPTYGIVPWGARTTASTATYIQETRTTNYVLASTEQGLEWTVFEPSDSHLWASVSLQLTSFLTQLWKAGGLYGSSASQAFFVQCDSTNNPPQVAGQLYADIGLALVFPSEFTVLRYQGQALTP